MMVGSVTMSVALVDLGYPLLVPHLMTLNELLAFVVEASFALVFRLKL